MALTHVGPYRILEHLGAGANGEVLLAEDTRLRRQVAIKTLSAHVGSDDSDLRRRLLREARAAARLNHPHIAAVYDILESDEGVHIVMEYVPGRTLASQLRVGPLPSMEVLRLGVQLSSALSHAHSLGVIHRDLKPANIITTVDGQAKILDFGLARLHGSDLSSTDGSVERHHVVGTPPYIPPEHLLGQPVDVRGDVYSLGVTLFEMLTGRRPFEARNGMSLETAILSAATPRPRALSPEVPLELDAVVHRAIARSPGERYGSAGDLEQDLRRVSSNIVEADTRSGRRLVFRTPQMARRAAVWVAVAAVVAAVGVFTRNGRLDIGGRFTTGAPAAATQTVVAVLPLSGAAGDPATEALAAGVADALITSLARVPGLTVVSRPATLKYRDRGANVDVIARELGATLLVDGAIQRSGENLRLTVSVLQPGSKVVRWQNAYDGTFSEVFTLQREVASAVAGALRGGGPVPSGESRPPTTSVEAYAEYSQARSFLERPDVKDNLDRGIALFQGAIAKDPAFARAHAGLGEAYWRKFEVTRAQEWATQARDEITEALRLDPQDTSVRLSLASLYRGLGRLDQAADELRQIVAAQPGSDEAHRLLGQILIERGRHAEGVAEIGEAIRLRPQYWAHHATLGQAYYRAGRYREAIPVFRRVTELQPDSAWGYQMLGAAYHSMEDTTNAIAPYERAIQLGNAKARGNLGLVYFDMGRLEDALNQWQEAARLDPTYTLNQHNVAEALDLLGRKREAKAAYERVAELCRKELAVKPNAAPTLATLALVESKMGQVALADQHIARAISLAEGDADVRYAEAVVNSRAGRRDQAIAALRAAVAAGYSATRLRKDPALITLKSHPSYEAALAPSKAQGGRT